MRISIQYLLIVLDYKHLICRVVIRLQMQASRTIGVRSRTLVRSSSSSTSTSALRPRQVHSTSLTYNIYAIMHICKFYIYVSIYLSVSMYVCVYTSFYIFMYIVFIGESTICCRCIFLTMMFMFMISISISPYR